MPERLVFWGLLAVGIDAGLWLGPHLPPVARADSLLFLLASGISALATGAGLGGAVLMVPALLLLRHLGVIDWPPTAISTVAALSAAVAAGNGARIQRSRGLVDTALAKKMGAIGAAAAIVTALWSARWTPPRLISADLAMALLAVAFLWTSPRLRPAGNNLRPIPTRRILAATAAVALSSGITGMPGSYLLIPLLLWISPLPYRNAAATTLQAIFVIASTTFLLKVHQGFFDLSNALPLLLGSIAGSILGAQWAKAASTKTLRLLATLTIILGSATTLFF